MNSIILDEIQEIRLEGAMTLSIMTFSRKTLCIAANKTLHSAQEQFLLVSVVNVNQPCMLIVVKLTVIMLNVVAPIDVYIVRY